MPRRSSGEEKATPPAISTEIVVTADCHAQLDLPAGSVTDALRLIARARIDCAVLDYKMPDGTTEPVADLLATRGVPFIFATGYYRGPLATHTDRRSPTRR
jgi:CheY-like chemotaxis protein